MTLHVRPTVSSAIKIGKRPLRWYDPCLEQSAGPTCCTMPRSRPIEPTGWMHTKSLSRVDRTEPPARIPGGPRTAFSSVGCPRDIVSDSSADCLGCLKDTARLPTDDRREQSNSHQDDRSAPAREVIPCRGSRHAAVGAGAGDASLRSALRFLLREWAKPLVTGRVERGPPPSVSM